MGHLYLGVDPSITNTGVVLLNAEGSLVLAYDGKTAKSKTPGGVEGLDNAFRFKAQVDGIVRALKKRMTGESLVIGFEDYAYSATHQAFSLGEYGGVLKSALAELGTKYGAVLHLLAPTHVKRFGAGNGMATKEEMMSVAAAECPQLAGASSDVCDAYFMAKIALYRTAPELAVRLDMGNKLLRHRLSCEDER